jgi:GNAT superfamily N-acetyltransferase
MQQIPIELQNPAITQLGIDATIAFYRTMAIDQYELPGLHAFVTGTHSPYLNVVIDTRNPAVADAALLETMSGFFSGHQVPWGWFMTALAQNQEMITPCFTLLDESPGMYLDLTTMVEAAPTSAYIIKSATADLSDWVQPLQEGYPSDDNCENYRQLNAQLQQRGETRLRHYTLYHEQQPAAAGTLFLSEKAVMLHNLATRDKFKKLGLATALTRYLLAEAINAGYQHCFLDTSEQGLNLYRRLGFKTYCTTAIYEKS